MSRRARARHDKRAIAYFTGDAPDIEAAFAKLLAERKPQEPEPAPATQGRQLLGQGVRPDGQAQGPSPAR